MIYAIFIYGSSTVYLCLGDAFIHVCIDEGYLLILFTFMNEELTTEIIYKYDNHQNIPWNIVEYKPLN